MANKDIAIEMAIAWFEWFLGIGVPAEEPPFPSTDVLQQLKKVHGK